MDLHRIAQEMRPVVYQAGYIAMQHFRQVKVEHKADNSFVTAADREVEHFIRGEIHKHFPDHGFYGEETGMSGTKDAEYIWAIDPIDGTAPFIFELPIWGISIGLIHEHKAMAGFMYLPALDDLYWALADGPAYLNNRQIRVCEPVELSSESTIVVSSGMRDKYDNRFPGRSLSFGSAAAHLCFIANGKLQGGLQESIRLYDIAGSSVVLKAAGGDMRYLSGREVDLWELVDGRKTPEPFVFGHPKNVERLLELFQLKDECKKT